MALPLFPLEPVPVAVEAPAAHHAAGLRPEVAGFGRRFGWRLRFDARTGQPSFGFGRPVPIERKGELLAALATIADVPRDQLVARPDRVGGRFTVVGYDQRVGDRPVAGGGIDLFVVDGAIQAAWIGLHRPPDDLVLEGMDFIAPYPRGRTVGYAGAVAVEADGAVTWFDANDAPLRRFTRVLDADGVAAVGDTPLGAVTTDAITEVRRWLARVDPDHPTLREPVRVAVDALGPGCRAELRDGVIRLGAGDGRCTPSRSADLLRHEFVHLATLDGLLVDRLGRAVAEGAADALATRTPVFGDDLVPDGLRDLATIRRLPADASLDVHQQGRVFGSMAWAWRQAAGPDGALDVDRWLIDLLRLGPTVDDLTELALLADDDDGDLANGTPNGCALLARLADHGLGSPALGVVRLDHVPVHAMSSGATSYPIAFDLVPVVPACSTFDPASVRVEVAGGEAVATVRQGTHHLALLPRVPVGRTVDYTLSWADAAGTRTRVGPFTFQVGDTRPVSCDPAAVDLDVEGAATLLRLEARRDARSPGARLTHGGRTIWSSTAVHDGGERPFVVNLRGHRGTGALEASGMALVEPCVVSLADPEGHHRVPDLRADGRVLRWTVPFVEPLHAVEISRHDGPVSSSAGGEVVARRTDVAPGLPMLHEVDGPGTYVVSVSDVAGHVYRSVVEGANVVTVDDADDEDVDTGRDSADSGDSGDSGRFVDSGAPAGGAPDSGW
jgi:hypothetical protein